MRLRIYATANLHPVIYTVWLKAEKAATCSDIQNVKGHQRNLVNQRITYVSVIKTCSHISQDGLGLSLTDLVSSSLARLIDIRMSTMEQISVLQKEVRYIGLKPCLKA